jgi:hypothetical protein
LETAGEEVAQHVPEDLMDEVSLVGTRALKPRRLLTTTMKGTLPDALLAKTRVVVGYDQRTLRESDFEHPV